MERCSKLIRSWVVLLLFTSFINQSFAAQEATDDPIQQTYQNWVNAMTTAHGDAKKVIALYSADAILVPTLSPNLHFNERQQFKKYFEKLTKLPEFSISTQKIVTRVYGDTAVSAGLYTFSYKDDIDELVRLPSRFTFLYHKQGSNWVIVSHHSSMSPPAID